MQNELLKWGSACLLVLMTGSVEAEKLEVKLPVVIAHRGASAVAPENTEASIAEAIRQGAKIIEIDVRKTRDGELVLFHDKEMERVAGRKGHIEDLNWADIRDLDVGTWFGQKFAGEKLIRLADAIELCRKGGAITLVEHKTGDAQSYAEVIRKLKAEGDVIVQSFNWDFLAAFRKELKTVPIGALGSKELTAERLATLRSLKPNWVGWNFKDCTETNLKQFQDDQFRVALYTVNESAEAEKWLQRGVDGIITDRPDRMLKLLPTEEAAE